MLLRWSLQTGAVPLPKANDLGHQAENLAVFDFELDDGEMRRLSELNEHSSALGPSLAYA